MRKALMIAGAVIALAVIVAGGVLLYAVQSLHSMIAERQARMLQRLSDSLDRKVEVSATKVSIGWGLMANMTDLKIADDPALSDHPFIEASNAYFKVELLPLLSHHLHVTEITLKNPEVHVIRTEHGEFNVSTLGKKRREHEETMPGRLGADEVEAAPFTSERRNVPSEHRRGAHAIYIQSLSIEGGIITYEERGPHPQVTTIRDVDLLLKDFSLARAFDVSLVLPILSDKPNVDISGKIGPLEHDGVVDLKRAPFALGAKIGPLDLAKLRAIGSIGKAIPEPFSVSDPVSFEAHADGIIAAPTFHLESDLSGNRIEWGESFTKPASVPLKLGADGVRSDAGLVVTHANLALGDLDANAQKISFGGGNLSAQVDTNRFEIGTIAKMVPALQKYSASGRAEIHTAVQIWNEQPKVHGPIVTQFANRQPRASGTISLADVSLSRPGDKRSLVNNLGGDIRLSGSEADAGPLKFDLGSGHATAFVHVNLFQPLNATYSMNIDTLKIAELAPNRPADENLSSLALNGTVLQREELSFDIKARSTEGDLANIQFKNLSTSATMVGDRLTVHSFQVGAFDGAVAANGTATIGDEPLKFALNLTAANVDIQSALESQHSKSANLIRGVLDAQLQVSGNGNRFEEIKPSLAGNGRGAVHDAKLVGINLATEALKKTVDIPGIGAVVPQNVIRRHPELSTSPDTDIERAQLSFALQGTRITTHDLVVQTPDYGMTGDGWFDMDKNLEMAVRVLLTRQLTDEIIDEKKNVVLVTDENGQVDIPMMVSGKLPKPVVVPDLAELAQRAASRALEQNVGKLLGKKGKGLNIPFITDGGNSNGNNAKPSNNPLDQLKGLFH
jgi:uncharacterized protein involved in outer membrane biogenesis